MSDDRNDTNFNFDTTDESFEALCNEIFESSPDCYIEKEYDRDWNLLYKSPPLDEVWLSEPGR